MLIKVKHLMNRPGWGVQVFHTSVGMVIFQILSFISGLIIARGLGAEGQGRFQLIMATTFFSVLLLKLGLDEAVAYLIPKYHVEAPDKVFGLTIFALVFPCLISATAGLAYYVAAEYLEKVVFHVNDFSRDLRYLIWLLPSLTFLLMGMAILRGLERSDLRAYVYYYLVGGGFLSLVLCFSLNGLNLKEVFLSRIISYIIGGVAGLYFVARHIQRSPVRLSFIDLCKIYKFAGLLTWIGLFQYLVEQPFVDLIILSWVSNVKDVGVYSVAARISSVVSIVTSAMVVGAAPALAKTVARGKIEQWRRQYQTASIWMATLTVFLGFWLFLIRHVVLSWSGPSYKAGAALLGVLLIGKVVNGISGFNTPVLLSTGYVKYEFLLTTLTAGIMPLSAIFLGRAFGSIGVALATSSVTAFLALTRWYVCHRVLSLETNYRSVFLIVTIGGISLGIGILSLELWPFPQLATGIVAASVAYCATFIGLGKIFGLSWRYTKGR